MAWKWRILRSAVEQEIQFPSKEVFEDYLGKLEKDEIPYEIVDEKEDNDGVYTAIMRKPYNHTKFLTRDYSDEDFD